MLKNALHSKMNSPTSIFHSITLILSSFLVLPRMLVILPYSWRFALFLVFFPFPPLSLYPNSYFSNELVGDYNHGTKLREWLPNLKFQLIYKATVYVLPKSERKKRKNRNKRTNRIAVMVLQRLISIGYVTTKDPLSPSSDQSMVISLVATLLFHGTTPAATRTM